MRTPQFFARRLWPDDEISGLKHKGMLPGFGVLLDRWQERLRKLGLSGSVASYKSCLGGIHLNQTKKSAEAAPRSEVPAIHYHHYFGEVHMGDVFQGISNSTIISRAKVENV